MKAKLLSLIFSIGLMFNMSSCTTTSWQDLKPLALPTTVLVLKGPLEKDPSKAGKLLKAADRLDTLAEVADGNLTLEDFIVLADDLKIDKEWAALASSVYEIYKPKVDAGNLDKAKAAIKEFAKVVRDAVNLLTPTK